MNYRETVAFLYAQLPMFHRVGKAAYKANLENTHTLDRFFGSPHRKFRAIHIAGTNGKGSVSSMLASVLTEAGCKTGLFTSPHLVDYRERMRVNGAMIAEADVIAFVEMCKGIIEEIRPSFFELTTAMAFWYFAKEKVDVAVIETGMGGRLDCTNIITPEISVITNIGLDHTDFLGDTIGKIAMEKAGIIKPNVPAIIGERGIESDSVFIEKAVECNSSVLFAEDLITDYEAGIIKEVCPLKGIYQTKNIVTALSALSVIRTKFAINDNAIVSGFRKIRENTGIRGRWEILQQKPFVVCDTGHNAHGIKEIVRQIADCRYKKLFMVIGMVNDKDIDSVLALLPENAYYIFTQASVPRAMGAYELEKKALGSGDGVCRDGLSGLLRFATVAKRDRPWGGGGGLKGEVIPDVINAYKKALSLAGFDDMVFVGGSTFVIADLLKELHAGKP